MAKKANDDAYEQFLADLKKINPKLEEVLDDATNAKLKESVLARSEFSRQSDALAEERKQLETRLAEELTKVQGWQTWHESNLATFATTQDSLKAYKEKFGELDAIEQRREAAKVGMTVEQMHAEMSKQINEHDVAAIKFVDELTDLKIEHRDRFKEKLDADALFKLAGERKIPLTVAYDLYTKDRVEEARKTDMEAQLKQAREDGAKEALSKHNLPTISSHVDYSHVLDVTNPLKTSNERVAAAAKDFLANRR